MADTEPPGSHPAEDPRVEVARRVVRGIGCLVALIMLGTTVLGAYHCATERPAREIFFDPLPDDPNSPPR